MVPVLKHHGTRKYGEVMLHMTFNYKRKVQNYTFPLQIQEEIYSTIIFSDKAGKLILGKIFYNIRSTLLIIFYLQ